ncbi:MAG TPA: FAD-binding oxidoreductase [Rhizomicrobium sp.]|nr:FAD-binding oxidoreductase [Rhizomicrobium sp.]
MSLSRRHFTAALLAAPAILRRARAAAPLPPLPAIAPADATFVTPGSSLYDGTLAAYNLRTELRPALRILAKTETGVAQALAWVREKNLAFALRSGGHSYEGFSQSSCVVIDTRLMNDIALSGDVLSVGAGTPLGAIYKFVAPRGLAFPGGSCPTVGVAGHALGGGFGLIARDRGLACDSLAAIDLVDADARPLHVDATTNGDLFWACRGGGGGTFGAATRLSFRLAPIGRLAVYGVTWALGLRDAVQLFRAWQAWAPNAPAAITGIFKLSRRKDGRLSLHAGGQSTGTAAQLARELRALTAAAAPVSGPSITTMSYGAAVNHFSGGWTYETGYSKAKSDFIAQPLPDGGIEALLGGIAALPANEVLAICDGYGGAIGQVAGDATAFAYRTGTQFCIQYYTDWANQGAAGRRTADLARLYAAMRPWSAGAYVNYCDLDLGNWQQAYWRQNLPRLQAVKAKFDPGNLFRHAQSVR